MLFGTRSPDVEHKSTDSKKAEPRPTHFYKRVLTEIVYIEQ